MAQAFERTCAHLRTEMCMNSTFFALIPMQVYTQSLKRTIVIFNESLPPTHCEK
jgi:hypothetical protein